MYERMSKIAEKYGLKLKIMKLPNKIRAFILELDDSIYIVINDSISDVQKEKSF